MSVLAVSYSAKQECDHGCTYANCCQDGQRHSNEDHQKTEKLVMKHKLFHCVINMIFKTGDTLNKCQHICPLLMHYDNAQKLKSGKRLHIWD